MAGKIWCQCGHEGEGAPLGGPHFSDDGNHSHNSITNTAFSTHLHIGPGLFAQTVLEHNLGCTISQHVDAKQLSSPTKQSQQ